MNIGNISYLICHMWYKYLLTCSHKNKTKLFDEIIFARMRDEIWEVERN